MVIRGGQSDRVAIMDHGRVITLDTPAALVASLGAEQIVEMSVTGELSEREIARLRGVTVVRRREGGAYSLTVGDIATALPALLDELARQGVKLETLSTHEATLEDVFVSLTGRNLRDG